MKNPDYIRFIVSKVESEFIGCAHSPEYIKVITVLHALKVSDNILRDIYVLSGIKKLRQLSSYLIFIIKKIESGSINIDNFIENYSADKLFIRSYFQTYYDLEKRAEEEYITEEVNTKFIFNEEDSDNEPPVYKLVESGFKVEELDNELVTEEFRESTITEDYSEPVDAYMTLEKSSGGLSEREETKTDDDSVFFTDVSDDVFNLPGEDSERRLEDSAEKAFEGGDDVIDAIETENQENVTKEILEEIPKSDELNLSKQTPDENEQFAEETEERKILSDLIPSTPEITEEEPFLNVPEANQEVDEKLQEIEKETSEAIMNSEFVNYEKTLFERNKILFGLFDDLILIKESSQNSPEEEIRILEEILSIAEEIRDYSAKMSFEVITGIYATLLYCFDLKFKDIVNSMDNFQVFRKSIEGIEDLIKGNDLTGFDATVAKLNSMREDLAKLLSNREKFSATDHQDESRTENKKYDFGEEESNIIREFKDSSEYDAFIILREKISELEETFQLIADMKDKTYPFESIRKLSVTFTLFREIVNIARVLEMNKAAHLAEAGYIFVKFVQNYRIDPFKEEVSEVFKYLIYSFKLLYLDKPVKDFDKFLSFLNEPVKIFYPKNNRNE